MATLEDIESLGYKKVGKTQKSRVGQGTPPELVPEEVKAKLKALKGSPRLSRYAIGRGASSSAVRTQRLRKWKRESRNLGNAPRIRSSSFTRFRRIENGRFIHIAF